MKKLTFLTMVLAIMFIATGNILAADGQVDLYPAWDFNSTEPNKAYVLSIGVNDGQKENPIYTLNNDWNDKISSIRVGKGVKITLYTEPAMGGDKLVLYPGEYKSLVMEPYEGFWNDQV